MATRTEPLSDEQAQTLYRRYAPVIHRRCVDLLGDPEAARDATHDVFLQLLDQLHTFRGEAALVTWIYRITTNHCLNRLRSRRRRAAALSRFATEPRPGPEPPSAALARGELLAALCRALDERTLRVLVHVHYDGLTQPEVARLLGISDRAVRKALVRAARTLEQRGLTAAALAEEP